MEPLLALACSLLVPSVPIAGSSQSAPPPAAPLADAAPASTKPAARPGFAVIAPDAWRGLLAPFVAARSAEHQVELASIESIVEAGAPPAGEAMRDAPERIKRWLFDAWKSRGVRDVLLVGDCDVLPVRFMVLDRGTPAAFNYAFYACDLYYADVADADGRFDDWNDARDGFHERYFGEVRGETIKDSPINFDRVSYQPELAVGRWPVSDAASLQAVIAKTLAWKPSSPAPRAFAVHGDGWIDARPQAQGALDELTKAGFAATRQFFGDAPAADGRGGAPTPASVAAEALRGVDVVFHLGHGSPDGWDRCLGPAEVEATRAAHPAVWFSIGCNTACFCTEPPYQPYVDESGLPHRGTNAGEQFTAPPPPPACLQPGPLNATGVGERLLRLQSGGAVAYIGCNTGAQPCALTLMEGFARAIGGGENSVGGAWRAALANYWSAEHLATIAPDAGWYPPAIFFQGMKFMLYGDPTLPLRPATGTAIAPAGQCSP